MNLDYRNRDVIRSSKRFLSRFYVSAMPFPQLQRHKSELKQSIDVINTDSELE